MINALGPSSMYQNVGNAYYKPLSGGGVSRKTLITRPDELTLEKKDENQTSPILTKKKLGIAAGLVATAGVVLAAIFCKGKTLNPANFAEHIEFSPAKTMEEAAEFAKKHLGIENFKLGDDVEMANWVNKALTNINNRFKGKAHMPKNVIFDEANFVGHEDALAYNCNVTQTLGLNEKYFNNIYQKIDKLIEKGKVAAEKIRNGAHYDNIDLADSILDKKYQYINGKKIDYIPVSGIDADLQASIVSKLTKYKADPKSLSRFQAVQLQMEIEDLHAAAINLVKDPLSTIKRMAKDYPEYFKQNFKDISYYEGLPKGEQVKKCLDIMSKFEKKYNIRYDINGSNRGASEFSTLYHEMGHLLHGMNASMKDNRWGVLSGKSFENFSKSSDKLKTAGKVSWYAQTNPQEFVAETFSALCAGKKLPDEVMEMYKYYKGPMIPNM